MWYNLKKVSTGKARGSMFIVACEAGNEQLSMRREEEKLY
jgi:hypothetical protein